MGAITKLSDIPKFMNHDQGNDLADSGYARSMGAR